MSEPTDAEHNTITTKETVTMSEETVAEEVFNMPVTDRSRFSTSWGQCMRKRFLEYHSTNGFGIRRKQQALPLATGIQVHRILEQIFKLGPDGKREQWREIVGKNIQEYKDTATASGIFQLAEETNGEGGKEAQFAVVEEQAALIEGLAWAACRVFVPKVFAEYEVVSVEQEEEYVLECDCGLGTGVGSGDEHEGRQCGGVVLMSKPDLILRHKTSGALVYVEFKTAGDVDSYDWRAQFESNVQLAVGVAGAERRLQETIESCIVVGFNKGWRKKGYNADTRLYDGPKTQNSFFCYAWKKEANPPHWEEEWRVDYNYVDADGKGRNLKGKGFEKEKVWEGEFGQRPAGWGKLEFWVEYLDEEKVASQVAWVGPLPVPRWLVKDLLEALGAEEKRWQERLWRVWEAKEKGETELRSVMNREVPQSWNCRSYNRNCSFLSICRRDEEAENEDGTLKAGWQFRRPHHDREISVMKRLGIPVPAENGEDEAGV